MDEKYKGWWPLVLGVIILLALDYAGTKQAGLKYFEL